MVSPVVLGADGCPASLLTALRAGKEAGRLRDPLLISHAIPARLGRRPAAEVGALLEEAILQARTTQPRISVTTEVVTGSPVLALVERVADAQPLVTSVDVTLPNDDQHLSATVMGVSS